MSVINLLNQIKNHEIVLPAIQRNFVWSKDKIYTLLDSIIRGYPVGIVLLWETYEDIRYRQFTADFQSETPHTFHDNIKKRKLKVVLDGQQRLQSLYVALYGKFNGQSLYFNVLSGKESYDIGQIRYGFIFGRNENMQAFNEQALQHKNRQDKVSEPEYWVDVKHIFFMGVKERQIFVKKLTSELNLDNDDELRIKTNLDEFMQALTVDENILKSAVVDENRPAQSPERKSETDVLEIFVRINRQGTLLVRSDLIYSMLKLSWKDSAEALPEFVQRINEDNSFKLTNDFVIRCLFAVCDLGAKFDLDLLRKKSNVEKMGASGFRMGSLKG